MRLFCLGPTRRAEGEAFLFPSLTPPRERFLASCSLTRVFCACVIFHRRREVARPATRAGVGEIGRGSRTVTSVRGCGGGDSDVCGAAKRHLFPRPCLRPPAPSSLPLQHRRRGSGEEGESLLYSAAVPVKERRWNRGSANRRAANGITGDTPWTRWRVQPLSPVVRPATRPLDA